MGLKSRLRSWIKAKRKRGALWVRVLDVARLLGTAEGRAVLWTRMVHRKEVHQTTPYTCEERYPALFDLAATLAPSARRILSFGCSTGEELLTLRRRFPGAQIIGAEINPRSRRLAKRLVTKDPLIAVIHPRELDGLFDLVFALAVLQREPHKISEMEVEDLTAYYPYERFDATVRELGAILRAGGLLCVANAHYRIEDSSISQALETVSASPLLDEPIFGPDGRRLERAVAHTIFRKR